MTWRRYRRQLSTAGIVTAALLGVWVMWTVEVTPRGSDALLALPAGTVAPGVVVRVEPAAQEPAPGGLLLGRSSVTEAPRADFGSESATTVAASNAESFSKEEGDSRRADDPTVGIGDPVDTESAVRPALPVEAAIAYLEDVRLEAPQTYVARVDELQWLDPAHTLAQLVISEATLAGPIDALTGEPMGAADADEIDYSGRFEGQRIQVTVQSSASVDFSVPADVYLVLFPGQTGAVFVVEGVAK